MASATKANTPPWDQLLQHYAGPAFIPNDPVSFPHAYRHLADWRNMECAAFIAAMFSYGRRDKILETVSGILDILGPEPVATLCQTNSKTLNRLFRGFYYRFNTQSDLVFLLARLGEIYAADSSLKALWTPIYTQSEGDLQTSISRFREAFLTQGTVQPEESYGLKFLFADPLQNSAAKRFNMFLRWMVRHDDVDLGLWADVTAPSALIIPLDTHVATQARRFKITRRKSNDWKTAAEITRYFQRLCPEDPVRYDFALFGLGIAAQTRKEGR